MLSRKTTLAGVCRPTNKIFPAPNGRGADVDSAKACFSWCRSGVRMTDAMQPAPAWLAEKAAPLPPPARSQRRQALVFGVGGGALCLLVVVCPGSAKKMCALAGETSCAQLCASC
jgi:hypothetical protein